MTFSSKSLGFLSKTYQNSFVSYAYVRKTVECHISYCTHQSLTLTTIKIVDTSFQRSLRELSEILFKSWEFLKLSFSFKSKIVALIFKGWSTVE